MRVLWNFYLNAINNKNLFFYFLLPFSLIYGAFIKLRNLLYDLNIFPVITPPIKVISVGNIAAGGTGKTPIVIFIVKLLNNKKISVITRGYKRRRKELEVVNHQKHYIEVGDEAYLLKRNLNSIPIIVEKDRVKACLSAKRMFSSDIVILDDGFQYRRLKKDLNIVVVDALFPFSNGYFLPAGLLRDEPSSLKRADLLILTHTDQVCREEKELLKTKLLKIKDFPIIETIHKPLYFINFITNEKRTLSWINKKDVFGLCSIGNPKSFERTLKTLGANIVELVKFSDHHRYTKKDLAHLEDKLVVSTEKDSIRFPVPYPFWILKVEIEITKGKGTLENYLNRLLQGV